MSTSRPVSAGKFLEIEGEKLYVRGVTYGTFAPDERGLLYPAAEVVESDFAQMAANGINAVRTYTAPPPWLLDTALRNGLRVAVGIPWEDHITFLDDRARARAIERKIRSGVRACADHPAILCYAIGNEIPSSIVRWYGRRRVERFLKRLYAAAKETDPGGLVTYVNYPTTEYLQLDFLDLCCFNVFLEEPASLVSYLARLQNLADDRPLLLAEIGLDSRRNGTDGQARSLDWQVGRAFESGCAGVFVFAWTDQWHRGGQEITDWDFGLTERDRSPKPALTTVRDAFAAVPPKADAGSPKVSVVVCAYNAESTIRECLEGLSRLNYPDYEVILVDDGSRDRTASIASEFDVRVLQTENRGLSSARNAALRTATGEIVAYIDSDAYPDPDWLSYLVRALVDSDHVGIGGPNLLPRDVGLVEECVGGAPGGPVHVLLTDTTAEHIPGCNMAFRREALLEVGGFDPRFRIAGDDVDVCWRLQERGRTLGYCAAAMVWHHRRTTVRAYWRQQLNYGRAEAVLERKWPEKYNRFGHPTWRGRIYGNGRPSLHRSRIYHGVWGTSPYQSLYGPVNEGGSGLPPMPESYLAVGALAALSILGVFWRPLLVAVPVLALAVALLVASAVRHAMGARLGGSAKTKASQVGKRIVTSWLYMLQPLARLVGRVGYNLTPWTRRGVAGLPLPTQRVLSHWSETWRAPESWLADLEASLRAHRVVVVRGGDHDRWDLEAWGGLFGGVRTWMAMEEHGWGKQLLRVRVSPRFGALTIGLVPGLAGLALLAGLDRAWIALLVLVVATMTLLARSLYESAAATRTVCQSVKEWEGAPVQNVEVTVTEPTPDAQTALETTARSGPPSEIAKLDVRPLDASAEADAERHSAAQRR